MNHCPHCYQPMNASAIIERFPEPAGWQFYGAPGARRIRCRGVAQDGTGYIHFIVTENGREYHRLAYGIAAEVEARPEQTALFEVNP